MIGKIKVFIKEEDAKLFPEFGQNKILEIIEDFPTTHLLESKFSLDKKRVNF